MSELLRLCWWLLVAHAVCDFPLQGDFLARGKNNRLPLKGVPWWICLTAHAVIQGAGVALVTGSPLLGLCEAGLHALIDYGKCSGWYGFAADQGLHLAAKLLWVDLCVMG